MVTVTRPLISDPFEAHELAEHVRDSLAGGSSMRMEVDAGGATVLLRTLPLGVHGVGVGAAVLIRDVTEVKRRDLALISKDATIREIHHRVKNNLQLIASIINMQSRVIDDADAKRVLRSVQDRVASLATIYKNLYQAEHLDSVEADRLISDIINQMVLASIGPRSRLKVETHLDRVTLLPDQAVPLTLLTTEAFTNALKYAFPAGRRGTIRVVLRRLDPERVELSVTDDGIGTAATHDPAREPGIGTGLIEAFVQQIDGRLGVESSDRGTRVAIVFPLREREREPAGDDA